MAFYSTGADAAQSVPSGEEGSWPGRVSRYSVPLVALIGFVIVRLPLLAPDGVIRGWNSDAAVFGLMAKKLLDGGGFDLYFWGQNYMGPLTAVFAAGWAAVVGLAIDANVWPLALRLGTMTNTAAAMVIVWGGLARFSRPVANATVLALAVGPPFFFYLTVVPSDPTMSALLGSILFTMTAFHLSRPPGEGLLDRSGGRFAFGFVAGVGWWMNQTIVFYLLGIAIVLLVRARFYPAFHSNLRIGDRLLLREGALGWPSLSGPARLVVFALEAFFLLQIVAFVARDLISTAIPNFFFLHPLREPLVSLLILHLLLAWRGREEWARRPVAVARRNRAALVAIATVAAGFGAGVLPTIAGKLTGAYPATFGVGLPFLYPREVVRTLRLLAGEVGPAWLGVAPGAWGLPFAAGLLVLLVYMGWRHRSDLAALLLLRPREYGAAGLTVVITLAALMIYVMTQRTPDTIRYLGSVVPMGVALVAFGVVELWRQPGTWRTAARAAAVAICAAALVSFGAGAVSVTQQIRSEPDPVEVIGRIAAEGCAVTYAGYWSSYKLRFLSEESLRFITIEWYDRTPEDTRLYESLPGRKCHLHYDGSITDYTGPPRSKPRGQARR
jgi:hypothetical protein